MIESFLPSGVAVATMEVGEEAAGLFDEELAALSPRAVEKRRQEFAAGRACARRAMQRLGEQAVALPVVTGGAPDWPAGLVGSISHTGNFAAAAVAHARIWAGIGIDVEQRRELEDALLEKIALPTEREWIGKLESEMPCRLMLFSAKESLHKLLHPLTGITLAFQDALIEPEGKDRFVVHFPMANRRAALQGRWGCDRWRVYTALAVDAIEWGRISAD